MLMQGGRTLRFDSSFYLIIKAVAPSVRLEWLPMVCTSDNTRTQHIPYRILSFSYLYHSRQITSIS